MSPERLETFAAGLPSEDLDLLERAMGSKLAQGWRADPASFAHHLDPEGFRPWRHTRYLSRKFVEAIRGEDVRQLWNQPSQTGKTTFLMRAIVWGLDHDPSLRFMYVSYDADKAVREAGEALDFARAHAGRLRFTIRRDIQARGRWVTDQGGGLYATGIGGGITGYPADVVIGDDLVKGWQEAHSEVVRERTWSIYQSQMRMRLQSSTGAIILVGTRWHEDDPTGKALKDHGDVQEWTLVRLPAIAEEPDLTHPDPRFRQPDALGREPGEVLEPERFDRTEVLARQAVLGSYLAAALEQQRPAPEEGTELQRGWWRWYTTPPAKWDTAISSWDTKAKDKQTGDYVVGQVWVRSGANVYLLEQVRGRWSQLTMECAIALVQHRHPKIVRHVVENTGYGPEALAALKEPRPEFVVPEHVAADLALNVEELAAVTAIVRGGLPGLIPENPKGDKRARARAHSGKLEAGNVWLPENDPEALALVNEAAGFPNATHDDMVDAWSQAMSRLTGQPATLSAPRRPLPTPRTSVGVSRVRPMRG